MPRRASGWRFSRFRGAAGRAADAPVVSALDFPDSLQDLHADIPLPFAHARF